MTLLFFLIAFATFIAYFYGDVVSVQFNKGLLLGFSFVETNLYDEDGNESDETVQLYQFAFFFLILNVYVK